MLNANLIGLWVHRFLRGTGNHRPYLLPQHSGQLQGRNGLIACVLLRFGPIARWRSFRVNEMAQPLR
jgi:hypothetical protein